jgi:hypothetical protein
LTISAPSETPHRRELADQSDVCTARARETTCRQSSEMESAMNNIIYVVGVVVVVLAVLAFFGLR